MEQQERRQAAARIAMLSPDACGQVCDIIDALGSVWIPRDPALPFHTLGPASYLDAEEDPDRYAELARRYNRLLDRAFGSLYEAVATALADLTGRRCVLSAEAARPGFHLFGSHPLFTQPIASIHFDRQYLDVPWEAPQEMDYSESISFTLPLRLPGCGGGLNLWPEAPPPDADSARTLLSPEALAAAHACEYLGYEIGEMVVHSGSLLHQIAPAETIRPSDRRVTLQGHGVLRNGVYQLYW